MQTFFETLSPISYGVVRYAEWNYIKDGLLRNLTTVKNYYKSRVFTVKSNHFLAKIINSINVPHSLNIERFYDNVDSKADTFSMAMKMTSSIFKGSLFTGVFYGSNNTEILISNSETFNPYWVHENWRNVCAVKPLLHPRSDLDLLLPNGKDTGSETGLTIISINIPMLLVQYRAFVIDQMKKNEGDSLLSVGHFIHMYVLPNMMDAHLDIALFNRINNLSLGAPLGESKRKHPFALPNYNNTVNSVHNQILHDMKSRKMEYEMILRTIPMVEAETLEHVMLLPNIAQTRQVVWVLILARLDALSFMVRVGDIESLTLNRVTINYFIKFFRMINVDKTLQSYLPYGMYLDTKYKIEEILNFVK